MGTKTEIGKFFKKGVEMYETANFATKVVNDEFEG